MNDMPLGVAADFDLDVSAGAAPRLEQTVMNWLKPMTFILVDKYVSGGFLIESGDTQEAWNAPDGRVVVGSNLAFMGLWVPRYRRLEMKKEGQRRWSNVDLAAHPQLQLKDDDCVIYGVNNTQYRVVEKRDGSAYGIVVYLLVEDYKFSGPLVQISAGPGPSPQPMDDGQGNVVIM